MFDNPFFKASPGQKDITVHIFSVPHNPSHTDFACCAFSQKARDLVWMLKSLGYKVYHYGNELSVDNRHPASGVECDEHITVTTEAQLMDAYPNCRAMLGHVDYTEHQKNQEAIHFLNQQFTITAAYQAKKRYKEGDLFCYVVPTIQRELYRELVKVSSMHIETGVGYMGAYMPYRVFESNAIRSWHYGFFANNAKRYNELTEDQKKTYPYNANTHVQTYAIPRFDAVIPNAFNPLDFDFRFNKEDYFLYLGRVIDQKGVRKAVEITKRIGAPLVVAGPGDFQKELKMEVPAHVEIAGPVNPKQRRELLSKARALICLSEYWEPFGGVHVQAMLSGTPPIASNNGGFCNTIRSGWNGYRLGLNEVEQGVWACQNLDKIDPFNLRDFGLRFSREQIALAYNEYFQMLTSTIAKQQHVDEVENPDRDNLNWLDFDRKIEWPEGWMTPVDEPQCTGDTTDAI